MDKTDGVAVRLKALELAVNYHIAECPDAQVSEILVTAKVFADFMFKDTRGFRQAVTTR